MVVLVGVKGRGELLPIEPIVLINRSNLQETIPEGSMAKHPTLIQELMVVMYQPKSLTLFCGSTTLWSFQNVGWTSIGETTCDMKMNNDELGPSRSSLFQN